MEILPKDKVNAEDLLERLWVLWCKADGIGSDLNVTACRYGFRLPVFLLGPRSVDRLGSSESDSNQRPPPHSKR